MPPRWRIAPWGGWRVYDSMMYLLIGSTLWKIHDEEAKQIERYAKKEIDSLDERELLETMQSLGIEQQRVTKEDKRQIEAVSAENVIDLIKQLKQLNDEGIITDEEFQSGKEKLLDSL